jgi:hypothetical protein
MNRTRIALFVALGISSACAKHKQAGEACETFSECSGTADCFSESATTAPVCVETCRKDAECQPLGNGTKTFCNGGHCLWTCTDATLTVGHVCVAGTFQSCETVANPTCDHCDICNHDTQFCGEDKACHAKFAPGTVCTEFESCTGRSDHFCQPVQSLSGMLVLDAKRVCALPDGVSCWPGDACDCENGACTHRCDDATAGCADPGTSCLKVFLGGQAGLCLIPCSDATDTGCGPRSRCADVGRGNFACLADSGPRPARMDGSPCAAASECTSGNCCPPSGTDKLGICRPANGC